MYRESTKALLKENLIYKNYIDKFSLNQNKSDFDENSLIYDMFAKLGIFHWCEQVNKNDIYKNMKFGKFNFTIYENCDVIYIDTLGHNNSNTTINIKVSDLIQTYVKINSINKNNNSFKVNKLFIGECTEGSVDELIDIVIEIVDMNKNYEFLQYLIDRNENTYCPKYNDVKIGNNFCTNMCEYNNNDYGCNNKNYIICPIVSSIKISS